MAKPQDSYPETATNSAHEERTAAEGSTALQEAIAAHGEELAGVIETTDELEDVLTTAILIAASADEAELEHITASTANLVEAADGLSTEAAADLATDVGDNARDLSATLETVLELERTGHLDDLVTIATAFAESLSAEDVEELSAMLEADGTEIVEALDLVLELQREDHLESLLDLAKTLSTLDADEDTARGLNSLLTAVGEAQRDSEPVGILGSIRQLRRADARAGLGYLLAILKAQGRQLRDR